MSTREPLTAHEIALAKAHFRRLATPEQIARVEEPHPVTGLRPGDDPEVIRAWLQRARGPEGFATTLYGTANSFDAEHEISRARRLGDEAMRNHQDKHPRPSADAIARAFWPESR